MEYKPGAQMPVASFSVRNCNVHELLLGGSRGVMRQAPRRNSSSGSGGGGSRRWRHTQPVRAQLGGTTTAAAAVGGGAAQGVGGLAGTAKTGGAMPPYLYGSKFGLPLVRKRLGYSELLRDIRTDQVDRLLFFTKARDAGSPAGEDLEGPCLVLYRDGRVAQGYVPAHDFRVPYAMEQHAVTAAKLEPQPEASVLEPAPPIGERAQQVLKAAPFVALLLVYVAVRISVSMKGDAKDREKIKRKEAEDRRRAREQEQVDRVAREAETMARMGMALPEIKKTLDGLKIPYDPEELEATVAKARRAAAAVPDGPKEIFNTNADEQRAAQQAEKEARAAEGEEEDMMAQSEAFLRMKTVKVQKARKKADGSNKKQNEMQMKLREAQRRLKGVKLQHIGDEDEAVGFDDVAGIGDAKVELMEIVDFFTKPELFRKSGSRIPKGVLLCGPPGTGKTLLARAVAGEAGVAFLSLNASEFVEMFAGVGAARVRDLFAQARALAPAIIFIDEIDAVGRVRGGDQGNDERDQTLNQMLSEMDGFSDETGVIVMAATNRRDILDPALIRPGRFDRHVFVGLPDFNGRIEIMKLHMAKHAVAPISEEQLHEIAFETQRFSGAQLANLVNMAAMFAARDTKTAIEYDDFVTALTWERLGPERPPYSGERQRRIAVQEAATALLCTLLPAIEPVVAVTIVPREKYPLGHTVVKINEQRELTRQFTRGYLEQQLLTTLAGRAAEELLYGPDGMSTLNERRLVMARRLAQKLVVSNAMTDNPAIGPRTVSKPARRVGKSIAQAVHRFVTPELHEAADLEMEALLNGNYALVKEMLTRNRATLAALVDALLERNTLPGDAVRRIVEERAAPVDLQRRQAERALFI